ncbi:nucleic acid-binding protein [Zopfia rhizophila CBS 207.26]|uniref:Nucleic acid-binding protein n=1 Tax=Zopfia rhizophila CBS 207.26 TaxID=1314779 RepID=A0A6A6EZH6_9PEZI|nr:nucleic acid-binding protein [Zopfia rhizophila CBS 207.26]
MSTPAPIVRKLISSSKIGVVISAGKMHKAVKVRIAGQEWNKQIRKYFPSSKTYLVSDPNSSLVEGDVIRIASGWRTSKSIRHVVTAVIAPFGPPIQDRPPIPTEEERMAQKIQQRLEKDVRAALRGRRTSILRLKEAEKQGLEIPELETAMRNVRLTEAGEKEKSVKREEAHKGQVGQMITAREKRRIQREKTAGEREAEGKLKDAKVQAAAS